jgi:hypothetical protein
LRSFRRAVFLRRFWPRRSHFEKVKAFQIFS